MAAIFISHSSSDRDVASEVRRRLLEAGHHDLFLDFDPEQGIPAGRHWAQEIYAQLRAADAVVVLCSAASMASKWVFAEFTHANALGKSLFPVKVAACDVDPILMAPQVIDLVSDWEGGWERLWRGFAAAGIDPAYDYDWDPSRPPYPGLLAFQETDAAIFFGREKEVQHCLDHLRRLQRFGGPGWLMVVGPSGSGKSSLVRAGVVPQLRRNPHEWLIVGPFRPKPDSLVEPSRRLVDAFDAAFERYRVPVDRRPGSSAPPESVHTMAQRLRDATGYAQATVLVIVDQMEELIGTHDTGLASVEFSSLLQLSADRSDQNVMALGTLRTDFLTDFLGSASTRGFEHESEHVGPPPPNQWTRIIEGPAQRARLRIEPELTTALVLETETEDALPLLAFTLRELWEQYGDDNELTVSEYRDKLGGLDGAVGRAAESVFLGARLDAASEARLRRVFLSMVRVNEQGRYVRQDVPWRSVEPAMQELVGRFVAKRLLVSFVESEERTLGVAHEALFRGWTRLKTWLDEGRDFLLWRQRLRYGRAEWERNAYAMDGLLRGMSLAEAESWRDKRRDDLDEHELEYITRSAAFQNAERDRLERRRRNIVVGLSTALLVAIGLASVAGFEWVQAERQRRTAFARQLAAQALANATGNQDLALLLGVEASSLDDSASTRSSLAAALQRHAILPIYLQGTGSPIEGIAFSPDGRFAAAPVGGRIRVWDVRTHQASDPIGPEDTDIADGIWKVVFTNDGQRIAASTVTGAVRLWDVSSRTLIDSFDTGSQGSIVWSMALSPDGRELATGGCDQFRGPCKGQLRLYDVETRALISMPETFTTEVRAVAYDPTGRLFAWGGTDGTVRLIDRRTRTTLEQVTGRRDGMIDTLAFSPSGRLLAFNGDDNVVSVWNVADRRLLPPLRGHTTDAAALVFGPGDDFIFSGGKDGQVILWSLERAAPAMTPLKLPREIATLAFSRDALALAIADRVGTLILWDLHRLSSPLARTIGTHEGPIHAVAVSPDGSGVASVGAGPALASWDTAVQEEAGEPQRWALTDEIEGDAAAFSPDSRMLAWATCTKARAGLCEGAEIRLVDPKTGRFLGSLPPVHGDKINSLAFSPDGRLLASASHDRTIGLWDVATRQLLTALRGHTGFVETVAFSPDGRSLASGSYDGTLILWDIETKQPIGPPLVGHTASVIDLAFDPSGQRLASGSGDRTIIIWDIKTRSRMGPPLQGHTNSVFRIAFSPDGQLLVSGGYDGAILVWNAHTFERLEEPLRSHTGAVTGLAFARDGAHLFSAGMDGTIKSWTLDTAGWRDLACASANRNLTWSEWTHYVGDVSYRKTCAGAPIHPSVIDHARSLAGSGDRTGAEALLATVARLDPALKMNPAEAAATFAATAQVERGLAFVRQGRVPEAVAAFKEARAISKSLVIAAESLNTLCWFGSLAGQASLVIETCDEAVASAPEDDRPQYRDSRGVARALLNRRSEAIEDFRAFIDWTRTLGLEASYGALRQQWVTELEQGRNPLDPPMLERLKREAQ